MSDTIEEYTGNQHFVYKTEIKKNPERYFFYDVESKEIWIDGEKRLFFKLVTVIYYNRKTDLIIEKVFYELNEFWEFFFSLFDENNKKPQQLHTFAWNAQFDFKELDGWRILPKLGWKFTFRVVGHGIFILELEKKSKNFHFELHFWDGMNYLKVKLEDVGRDLGVPKGEIDFDNCTKKELEIYCQQDTRIVYEFIKQMVGFTEEFGLSELRMTAPSMAMNTWRSKFHHPKKDDINTQIGIHTWKQIIELERLAYKGAITEVYRHGETFEEIWKLDFNSCYSNAMANFSLPIRLIGNLYEKRRSQEKMFKFYNYFKKGYLFILHCSITLPEDRAYLIKKALKIESILNKNLFVYTEEGKSLNIVLCTPELEFVEKWGTILKIHHLAVYARGMLFKEYIEFFYNLKLKFGKDGNKIFKQIAKLFLNSFYGKWGQKKHVDKVFSLKTDTKLYELVGAEVWRQLKTIIKERNLSEEDLKILIIYITDINKIQYWLMNGEIHYLVKTEENEKNTFVAIPAFITSYCRMFLVEITLIAGRKNCYYSDTDSLHVNETGFKNLQAANMIETEEHELGLLKIEGKSEKGERSAYWGAKKYELHWKCFKDENKDYNPRHFAGLKKDAVIEEETDKFIRAKQEKWKKDHRDKKEGIYDYQVINIIEITFSKVYDKGKVDSEGYVHPYSWSEVCALE